MESSKIKAIDKTSVHRICSGQVVLNLAVAVKELIENSLDAGGTVINVRLKEHGSELLEVTDNGCGVHPDNFEGLTLKHHTSKLKDFSDLESIATFGFRGEALSSLCALSKVSISTRHESQDMGTCLVFEHTGAISSRSHIPRQVGTTVSLSNLFSTLPVRQKEFHRNIKREFNKMTQLLNAYCLVSVGVKISCTNQTSKGSKTTFVSTLGCPTVRENISSVFGPKQLTSLLEIKTVKPNDEALLEMKIPECMSDMFKLDGFISSCAHGSGRPASDRQFYYINSRPCEPSKVIKAVNEVYHQYNLHQVPFVFMNILVERTSVDVNVTPDKRQVFLEQEKLLIATIKASLGDIYEKIPSTFTVNNLKRPASFISSNAVAENSKPSLSKFIQFRHKSDANKESPSLNNQPTQKSKQIKLDHHFISTSKQSITSIEKKLSSNLSNDNGISTNFNQIRPQFDRKSDPIIIDETNSSNNSEILNDINGTISNNKCYDKKIDEMVTLESINQTTSTSYQSGTINGEILMKNIEINEKIGKNDETSQNMNVNILNNDMLEDDDLQQNLLEEIKPNLSENITVNNCVSSSDNMEDMNESNSDIIIKTDCDSEIPDRKVLNINFSMESLRKLCSDGKLSDASRVENPDIRFRMAIDPLKNSQAELELSREISKDMFSKMEIVGQFNLGFIITKLNSDLFIVDQHATDEKYNFETLQQTTALSNQKLVVPQNLELTAANECILLENIEVFRKNGFDFAIDDNGVPSQRVKLSGIPMSKNWLFGKEDIDELIFMLQDVVPGTMCRPSRVRAMFASRACRMSVMIGSHLSRKDMRRLIDHMGTIEQPWNCPHGRPTMRHLVNLELMD